MEWTKAKETAIQVLRAAYLARVEQFAESARSRFEAGTLYSYRDRDFRRADDDRRSRALTPLERHTEYHPVVAFQEAIRRDFLRENFDEAVAVMFCSPSAEHVPGDAGDPVQSLAEDAILWDVLRIARSRGWYTATNDESPRDEELGLAAGKGDAAAERDVPEAMA